MDTPRNKPVPAYRSPASVPPRWTPHARGSPELFLFTIAVWVLVLWLVEYDMLPPGLTWVVSSEALSFPLFVLPLANVVVGAMALRKMGEDNSRVRDVACVLVATLGGVVLVATGSLFLVAIFILE